MTVAVVAALASIVAALLSWKSAHDSRHEARQALRANQLLAAHDAAVERLRSDVADFIRSLVVPGMTGEGATMAAVTVLAVNPMCSPHLRDLTSELARVRTQRDLSVRIDDTVRAVEDETRAILERANTERVALLPS